MIVVDASALVDHLTFSRRGRRVEHQLAQAGRVAAPDLVHVEVASALWRQVRAGALDPERAAGALEDLQQLPLVVLPHKDLVAQAWAFRKHTRIADAFYLAGAELLDVPLLTTDARLARGHYGVPVTLVT